MRDVDSDTETELQARAGLVSRDFLWIETVAGETAGFWCDVDTVTVTVLDGETLGEVTRDYVGSGTLISIDPIPLQTLDAQPIRTINVTLSQVDSDVLDLVRGYDVRLAKVEIHRGLFSRDTRDLIAPPVPHFLGRVNGSPIVTPALGGEGSIALSVVSITRDLTRINPAKRSDADQKLRASGDTLFEYATTAGTWDVFWGEKKGTVGSTSS